MQKESENEQCRKAMESEDEYKPKNQQAEDN